MSIVEYESSAGYFIAGPGPEAPKPTKGIVVIQEWWGINEQIRRKVEKYAKQGYLAIAPDLYHGRSAATADEARHLFDNLDWPRAVEEIAMAARYLKKEGAQKVGAVGYCMGGGLALAVGVRAPDDVSAVAPFYGTPPDTLADTTTIKVPVQAHFGTKDESKGFSDPETARKLEANLKASGVKYEFYWYEGAEHAFTNEARPEKYRPEYAEQSFQRTLGFFGHHLENRAD